ncbi:MAG: sigma-E factor negative regulatory protein [Neisseriaceae bacterium]|nr:sigma-E factor negative regulatory protein [Neisseriaceae bacterium]
MKSQQLETLSALMDDELSAHESQAFVEQLLADPEAQAAWLSFHVVKDGMQKTECGGNARLFASICAELDEEPTVVMAKPAVPARVKPAANQWYRGLSVAASVLVAAVAIWQMWPASQAQMAGEAGMMVSNDAAPTAQEPIMNVSQSVAAPRVDHSVPLYVVPANSRAQDYLNDPYLRAHQEVLNQDEWVNASWQQEGQR